MKMKLIGILLLASQSAYSIPSDEEYIPPSSHHMELKYKIANNAFIAYAKRMLPERKQIGVPQSDVQALIHVAPYCRLRGGVLTVFNIDTGEEGHYVNLDFALPSVHSVTVGEMVDYCANAPHDGKEKRIFLSDKDDPSQQGLIAGLVSRFIMLAKASM